MSEGIRVRRMKTTSDLGVTEPAVNSPTTAADFYNPRRTASYGVATDSMYQGTGSVASSCLPVEENVRALFPTKAPRSASLYPPVPVSISSTVASTGMRDMRLAWEAADRVPDMVRGANKRRSCDPAFALPAHPLRRRNTCLTPAMFC